MPTSNTRVVCSVLSTGLCTRANNFADNILFPTKSTKEICFFHISVFYSGLMDLVHVKTSNTTALSSSSPHSSVRPSVFSLVSQC